jgi:hypothetical protein
MSGGKPMFATNVPNLERLARILLGVGIAGYAFFALPGPSLVLVAMGVCVALTGLVGFCPACALVGRRPRPRP